MKSGWIVKIPVYSGKKTVIFYFTYIGDGSNHGVKCKCWESLGLLDALWMVIRTANQHLQIHSSYGSSWSTPRKILVKKIEKERKLKKIKLV